MSDQKRGTHLPLNLEVGKRYTYLRGGCLIKQSGEISDYDDMSLNPWVQLYLRP